MLRSEPCLFCFVLKLNAFSKALLYAIIHKAIFPVLFIFATHKCKCREHKIFAEATSKIYLIKYN
jgi:hypothetical protein